MTAVLDQISQLRDAAQAAGARAAKAQVMVDQKKQEVATLTAKLKEDFGCETWAEAHTKLAELAAEAESATTKARETLLAEGIIQ